MLSPWLRPSATLIHWTTLNFLLHSKEDSRSLAPCALQPVETTAGGMCQDWKSYDNMSGMPRRAFCPSGQFIDWKNMAASVELTRPINTEKRFCAQEDKGLFTGPIGLPGGLIDRLFKEETGQTREETKQWFFTVRLNINKHFIQQSLWSDSNASVSILLWLSLFVQYI